jgi:hypothetical protein
MIYWLTYQIKLHQKIEAEIKKDNNEEIGIPATH